MSGITEIIPKPKNYYFTNNIYLLEAKLLRLFILLVMNILIKNIF